MDKFEPDMKTWARVEGYWRGSHVHCFVSHSECILWNNVACIHAECITRIVLAKPVSQDESVYWLPRKESSHENQCTLQFVFRLLKKWSFLTAVYLSVPWVILTNNKRDLFKLLSQTTTGAEWSGWGLFFPKSCSYCSVTAVTAR